MLAAPLTQRHTYDDVTQAFDLMESEAGRVRVGLAHGSVTGRLPDTIDATNPIAADRAARARLDYLALGDWHGCLRVDERCWYAGTPEQDRFRGNEPGYVLDVRIAGRRGAGGRARGPGPLPLVGLARDAELADRCPGAGRPSGRAARRGRAEAGAGRPCRHARLGAAATRCGRGGAQARALLCDFSGLLLEPDEADFAQLGASGYVAEVAAQLQAMQAAPGDEAQAAVASEALRLLLRMQREAAAEGGAQ